MENWNNKSEITRKQDKKYTNGKRMNCENIVWTANQKAEIIRPNLKIILENENKQRNLNLNKMYWKQPIRRKKKWENINTTTEI